MKLLYEELTGEIIASFYAIRRTFKNRSYSEVNYANALVVELRERGHQVQQQKMVPRLYHRNRVGEGFLDLVVDQKVLVEVKKVHHLTHAHHAQTATYLLDSGLAVGLLLNFGASEDTRELPFHRLFEPNNAPPATGTETAEVT